MMQGVQFLSTIKVEKTIKSLGYVISDRSGGVDSISACI